MIEREREGGGGWTCVCVCWRGVYIGVKEEGGYVLILYNVLIIAHTCQRFIRKRGREQEREVLTLE